MKNFICFMFFSACIALLTNCATKYPYQENICIPVEKKGQTETLKYLGNGTYLYLINGEKVRGPKNHCKCLPGNTKISTPKGEISISELEVGDKIYSVDYQQNKIVVPILAVQKIPVPKDWQMLRITLKDGRQVLASPNHPQSVAYRFIAFSDLKINNVIDNTQIVSIDTVDYGEEYTYDILPENDIADYWANDVRIGSSMYPSYFSDDPKLFLECVKSSKSEVSSGACCSHTTTNYITLKSKKKLDDFEIISINGFELKGLNIDFKTLIKDEFVLETSYNRSSGIFSEEDVSNTSIKLRSDKMEFYELNPGTKNNPTTRITSWPLRIKYSDSYGKHDLILLAPDETNSIYPP